MGISSALFLPDGGLRMHWTRLARRIPAAYHAIYDVWYFLYRGFSPDPGIRSFEREAAVRAKDEPVSSDGRHRLGSGIELVARSSVGIYLSVQWVSWRYGTHLMEEWEMARWRSRAALHFLGSLYAPDLEYRFLGGQR